MPARGDTARDAATTTGQMTTIAAAWIELIRTRQAYLAAVERLREAVGGTEAHD